EGRGRTEPRHAQYAWFSASHDGARAHDRPRPFRAVEARKQRCGPKGPREGRPSMGYRDDSKSHRQRAFWSVISLAVVVAVAVGLGLPVVAAEAAAAGRWRDAVGDIGPRYGHVAVR